MTADEQTDRDEARTSLARLRKYRAHLAAEWDSAEVAAELAYVDRSIQSAEAFLGIVRG